VKILAVVPARGGSTRVPRKNLVRLGGRTLVRRALETSLAAACFESVALSSDLGEILAEADGLSGVVPLERPAELATDAAGSYGVVVDALARLDPERSRYDAVAVVQCTSPFTAPEDLRGAVALLERSGAPSVVSVVRVDPADHPLKLKVLDGDRLLPFVAEDGLARGQDLPPLWRRNGSVYLSRMSVLEGGALLDPEDVRGYEMPAERSYDIDSPTDVAFAEFLVERGLRPA
jgi:CMP-N-acetylneuraminic acid synthetase